MMANRLPHASLISATIAALLLSACRDATPRPGIPTPVPAAAATQAPDAVTTATTAAPETAEETDAETEPDPNAEEGVPAPQPTALDPAALAPRAALPAVVKLNPTSLGQAVESLPVAGVEDAPGTPFVEAGLPAHVRIAFGGVKPNTTILNTREPQVLIIPIAGYLAKFGAMPELQEEVQAQIDELRTFLKERTITDAETITVLPPINAAQLMHSRIEYLDLPNGRGVRFLTAYSTDPITITAANLFYTFQGVTNDGLYYISAFFPIDTTKITRTPAEVTADENEEAVADFASYLARISQQLEAGKDTDFTPALSTIDAVIRSIEPLATAADASVSVAPTAVVTPTAAPTIAAPEPTVTLAAATTAPTLPVIPQPTASPVPAATETTAATLAPTQAPAATATVAPTAAPVINEPTARPPAMQLQVGRTTTVVNLRSAASTRSRIVIQVPRNTAVTVLGRTANNVWLRVRLRSGRVGWMAAAYIRGVNVRRVPIVR